MYDVKMQIVIEVLRLKYSYVDINVLRLPGFLQFYTTDTIFQRKTSILSFLVQ